MINELKFDFLHNLTRDMGIVLNGQVYLVHFNARDAVLEFGGASYPLRFQGTLKSIVETEEVVKAIELRDFRRHAIEQVFSNFLSRTVVHNLEGLLVFECLDAILPDLDYFDSRVNTMPRSDLIQLRRKEFLSKVSSSKKLKPDLTRSLVRRQIQSLLDKTYEAELPAFDYNPDLLFLSPDEIYQLEPRFQRGDVVFSRGKTRLLYKKATRIPDLFKHLNQEKNLDQLEIASDELSNERIDAFAKYLAELKHGYKLSERDLEVEHSGLRWLKKDGRERLYVYIHPTGFAMRSIEDLSMWYPFPNPPEVGVFLYPAHDNDPTVSEIHVNGNFTYLNFISLINQPRTFCGPGKYNPKPNLSWQENVVDYIMHGVHTLHNGMSRGAHIPNLPQIPSIPEQEADDLGLLKTNIHPIDNR